MESTMGKQRYVGAFMWPVIAIGGVVFLFSVYQLPRYSLPRLDLTFILVALLTAVVGSRVAVKIPRIGGAITLSDTLIFPPIPLSCRAAAAPPPPPGGP